MRLNHLMELCAKNGWKYIFTQKDTRQKQVGEAYEWIKEGNGATEVSGICEEKGTGRYVNHVEETAGKKQKMNILEYQYTCGSEKSKKQKLITFQWITNIDLDKKNTEEMIKAARGRWKIENEGFNNQKNGIYRIEHLNSKNPNAMKNHYLLTQMSDILMQIYLVWNPLVKEIKQSIKNTSSMLLESFRRQTVTDEDVHYITRYTSIYLE